MLLRKLWRSFRRSIPISLYPALAIPYRWEAKRVVRRLARADDAYFTAHPGAVAPGATLRFKVVGACDIPGFLAAGRKSVAQISAALSAAGVALDRGASMLDWGCGCGRTVLAWREAQPDLAVTGADVDGAAIAWCQAHIPGSQFAATGAQPPLPFADSRFDLICAISVFTHLDEARQDRWLTELRRVLRPGGVLLATVHGPKSWEGLPRATVRRIRQEGIVFARTAADKGRHPDWYQTTWHTEAYVRRHWSRDFEIAGYISEGMSFDLPPSAPIVHDVVVLRRPIHG